MVASRAVGFVDAPKTRFADWHFKWFEMLIPLYVAILACAVLALCAVLLASYASAASGDFYTSYVQAKVIAHLPLSPTARQMFLQPEGRKLYLYIQQPSQQGFTIVDVSKPAKPKIVSHVPHEKLVTVGSGLAIAENSESSSTVSTPATGSREDTRGGGSAPESVGVLDVSDPAHPQTVQTFSRVTNILSDDARGLIFVANGDGVWILSHQKVWRRHECSSSDAISEMPNCN